MILLLFLALLVETSMIGLRDAEATPLLTVQLLSRQRYDFAETANVSTSITLNGNPIDALAAVEIDYPNGNPYVIRTVETGNVTGQQWLVKILGLTTCDLQGNSKTVFTHGSFAYINLTITNLDVTSHNATLAIYVQGSDNMPLAAFYPLMIVLESQQTIHVITSVPISNDAPLGEARVFASVFTGSPKNMGTAFSPGAEAVFYIETTTPTMPPQPRYSSMTFALSKSGVGAGNFTIYAAASYSGEVAGSVARFRVVFLGDIVADGVIDIRDVSACVLLFRTSPQSPNWNPDADVNEDGIVDMRDIVFVILRFGRTL
jgi:hypothetical protein